MAIYSSHPFSRKGGDYKEMKLLDKHFVKNRKNHYCFKYSKKYLRTLTVDNDLETMHKIIKFLDYPWCETIVRYQAQYAAQHGRAYSFIQYINYCRLCGFTWATYADSQRWGAWVSKGIVLNSNSTDA